MVGDVVLGRISSCQRAPRHLAVGGQDIIHIEAGRIDEVAAVVVLHCPVLAYRQLVAAGIVDVGHSACRAARDGLREFEGIVSDGQSPEAVGGHRAIGIVGVCLVRAVALERSQFVRPTGVGIDQGFSTGAGPGQAREVAVRIVGGRLAVSATVGSRCQATVYVVGVGIGLRAAACVRPSGAADVAAILRRRS